MRHKVQDLDKRLVLLAGAGCALILCLALYLYFGRSVNKEKRVNHAAPLVKVQQVVRQDMMRHIALSGQTVTYLWVLQNSTTSSLRLFPPLYLQFCHKRHALTLYI